MTDPDMEFPCTECGALRTVAQGGKIFTVCDDCWDKTCTDVPPALPSTSIYTNDGSFCIYAQGREMLRIGSDGGFYVEERLTTTDMEVYEAFKSWLEQTKCQA